MKHDMHMTASARAILAAGQHLRRKDGGDVVDILSRKLADMTDATVKRLEETEQKVSGVSATMDRLEQKMARGMGAMDQPMDTWGKQFTRQQEGGLHDMKSSRHARASLELKMLSNDPASAGAMTLPYRDSANLLPKQRLTVRNLLQVVSISSGSVEYVQQGDRPTGAGMVAEGAPKPESSMDFSLKSTSAKVIAHWIKASRQVLEDLPQLSDLIDSEMRYGLALAEEVQILNGNGQGQNLSGLITNSTPFVDPLALADATMLDTLGAAILQSALADYPATGIVMHPADWTRLRLLKNADGEYLLGEPAAAVDPRLFGLPVVPTKAMAVNTFLVGNFPEAATLYDRWEPRVEVGYVNDDFTRNLVTVLAEERLALAVKNPTALTHGSFA